MAYATITTNEEYETAMAYAYARMNAAPQSLEEDELSQVADAIVAYERAHFMDGGIAYRMIDGCVVSENGTILATPQATTSDEHYRNLIRSGQLVIDYFLPGDEPDDGPGLPTPEDEYNQALAGYRAGDVILGVLYATGRKAGKTTSQMANDIRLR